MRCRPLASKFVRLQVWKAIAKSGQKTPTLHAIDGTVVVGKRDRQHSTHGDPAVPQRRPAPALSLGSAIRSAVRQGGAAAHSTR